MVPSILTSPDGTLTFTVEPGDGGNRILGFKDFPWHTHSNLLVGWYGASEEDAVENFVQALLHNRAVIVVHRRGGYILDVRITDTPDAERRNVPEGQTIELRHWDGTAWTGA